MAENEEILEDRENPSYTKFLFATEAAKVKPVIQGDSSSPTPTQPKTSLKNPHQKIPIVQNNLDSSVHLDAMNFQNQERWDAIEERIKAIEESKNYGLKDIADMCLVSDLVVPPKFKVPQFDKYRGTSCPKDHLTMYVRKMTPYIKDDKLLIHFFQESLTGAATIWYIRLERSHIQCFKDLCKAFVKQFEYNIDIYHDRMHLKSMCKRDDETFKEYVQRWGEVAIQVKPKLSDEESVSMFIDTLPGPFFNKLLGGAASDFLQLVRIGEIIERDLRSGRRMRNSIEQAIQEESSPEDMEEEAAYVTSLNQPQITYPQSASYPQLNYHLIHNQSEPPQKRKRKRFYYDPIPMPYSELLPQLFQRSLLIPAPLKKVEPPYPEGFDQYAQCEYHAGAMGHATEDCNQLKNKVQQLIKEGLIRFQGNVLI